MTTHIHISIHQESEFYCPEFGQKPHGKNRRFSRKDRRRVIAMKSAFLDEGLHPASGTIH